MRTLVLLLAALPCLADFSGRVVGISDGDTIKVLSNGRAEKVRLWGVDAPEKAQPWGSRARQFTGEMVFGRQVTVRVHDTDRYGRVVGEVVLADGRSLNRELLRAGLAWWYTQYSPREWELQRLEAGSRQAHRGLWADANPVAPWDWRKAKRAGGSHKSATRRKSYRVKWPRGW
jgi:endonuclease YncB( thermonuclease family)